MTRTAESHLQRTAAEPRDPSLHTVTLSEMALVGQTIRVLRFQVPDGAPDMEFRPGQWVDTYCPGIPKAGGFTITSPPSRAATQPEGGLRYMELAVRQSPENPAATWLWQPAAAIRGAALQVRVGGSFVYPPGRAARQPPARVVFVAGGVGINPLISMLSHLGEQSNGPGHADGPRPAVEVLYSYSMRDEVSSSSAADRPPPASHILFLERLATLFATQRLRGSLRLFLTGPAGGGPSGVVSCKDVDVPFERRRIATSDLDAAVLGSPAKHDGAPFEETYVYVCGVPAMTDAFVAHLIAPPSSGGLGLPSQNVLYEKWW